jgi:hypothetical protein
MAFNNDTQKESDGSAATVLFHRRISGRAGSLVILFDPSFRATMRFHHAIMGSEVFFIDNYVIFPARQATLLNFLRSTFTMNPD